MESNCSIDLWEEQLDVFNFSNTSFLDLDELDSTFTWKEYLKMSVYLVTIVAALVGNFAVIVTVVTNRVMRTTINYYLLNLAVADTLICIFCMWVHFVNSLSTFYVLGSFMCRFEGFAKSEWLPGLQQLNYAFANGIRAVAGDTRVRTLLYCMNLRARVIVSSLMSDENAFKSYVEVTQRLTSYFVHPVNEVYESSRFHKRSQQSSETVDSFFTTLRNMVRKCNYPSPAV
nr:QRFP-like peptide receptor [Rhipicephalus microplus]